MTKTLDAKVARLAQKVFEHLQGNMSATFGWQGNDPDGYTLALKAHNQKTVDLIAADLRAELSAPAVPCITCASIHVILDLDESMIVRNAKDAYPEGRTPRELALADRVISLCKYAADWKRWCLEAEAKPQPASDKLRQIIASMYQIAGALDAPEHVLDVLANPELTTQAQIDALLPFGPAIAQPLPVPSQPLSGRAAYKGMHESMLHWQGKALEAEASNKQLVRALREEVEGPTFMGEPVIQPAIASQKGQS